MTQLYDSKLIKFLQNEIDNGRIKMINVKEYTFMEPFFNSGELILRCYKNYENDKCVVLTIKEGITTDYVKYWKYETPAGKFLMSDYKHETKDFIGNNVYYEVKYKINNIKIKALVRLLVEITDIELTSSEKEEYIEKYGDLLIDNKYFSLIKLCLDDENYNWGSPDIFKSSDLKIKEDSVNYNTENIIDAISVKIDKDTEEDNINSEPLF